MKNFALIHPVIGKSAKGYSQSNLFTIMPLVVN